MPHQESTPLDGSIEEVLRDEPARQIKPSIEQETAIELCMDKTKQIVGVTGGAGTGKTFVLGQACYALSGRSMALCAPTGRAAKRIQELTGIRAVTIHRLLQFPQPDDEFDPTDDTSRLKNEPKRNRQNPLTEDFIFVDEASMLSPSLYRHLMDALKPKGCIRFFGDNNQLPPVEEGDPPFFMILEKFPSVELSYNYRSTDAIIGNSLRILRGRVPLRNDRFRMVFASNPIMTMIKLVTTEFASTTAQVILPTRRGSYGTQRVNPSLQMKLNRKGKFLRLDRFNDKEAKLAIREGDKFIWVKNDYQLSLFNGEIGHIDWIDFEDGSISLITGEDRNVVVPPMVHAWNSFIGAKITYDPRKQLELGYAITTHKSQGSEFETVIYCITRSQFYMLNRRNFYTAITRAKKNVIIVSDAAAVSMSLRRWQPRSE